MRFAREDPQAGCSASGESVQTKYDLRVLEAGDPAAVTSAMNAAAGDGWRVVALTDTRTFGAHAVAPVLVLKR